VFFFCLIVCLFVSDYSLSKKWEKGICKSEQCVRSGKKSFILSTNPEHFPQPTNLHKSPLLIDGPYRLWRFQELDYSSHCLFRTPVRKGPYLAAEIEALSAKVKSIFSSSFKGWKFHLCSTHIQPLMTMWGLSEVVRWTWVRLWNVSRTSLCSRLEASMQLNSTFALRGDSGSNCPTCNSQVKYVRVSLHFRPTRLAFERWKRGGKIYR